MKKSIEFDKILKDSGLNVKELQKRIPIIDNLFNEQARSLKPELLKVISDFVARNRMGLFSGKLSFSLTLDTNALFSCIYNKLIKNQESILIAISKNPMVTIYYSNYVREEMLNNIQIGKLKSKNGTVDKSRAIEYLDEVLSSFELVKDSQIVENANFTNRLKERDPKDIPIINLAFSKRNQGILTNDRDFEEIPEIKKWNFSEFGGTVCTMNKGILSLAFTELSVGFISVLCDFLLEFIREVYSAIVKGIKLLIDGLKAIPSELYAIFGGIAIGLLIGYFWNDGKAKLSKLSDDTSEYLQKIIDKSSQIIDNISKVLKDIGDSEWFHLSGGLVSYLIASNAELQKEVNRLKELEIGLK